MSSIHPRSRVRAAHAVALAMFALLAAPHVARAGTTGTLTGYVLAGADLPVAGAKVSVSSPTESQATVTDADGYFAFIALPPETYTVSAVKDGYEAVRQTGFTVVADNALTITLRMQPALKVLSRTVVVPYTNLLRPSTTQDVYAITAAAARTVTSFGGGGDLESAYSAIAAVPGTFVPTGQQGWNQPVFLRGGDFNEIGYELDGVPVNRSLDHLPTTNLSSLGVQSLEVYTGGAPADAQGQGLSGYVNQVIRQGAYPGFADLAFGVGTPAFYNKLDFDAGGATVDHRFSYFAAIGGYDQGFRYYDQNNGASVSNQFGAPFDFGGGANCFGPNGSNYAGCYANHAYFQAFPAGPGGYVLGPYQMGKNASIADRENVVNLHFRIPRRSSADHDDLQLLYDASQLYTYTYSSYQDWGGSPFWSGVDAAAGGLHSLIPGGNYPIFGGGFAYAGALGQAVSGTPGSLADDIVPYDYPSESQAGFNGPIPADKRDATSNGQAIIKVQLTHTFGTTAFARVEGYSYYSDEFVHSPNGSNQFYISNSLDSELWTHTRGYSVSYADQLNSKHLFDLQASYALSHAAFFDNQQMSNANPLSPQSYFAALVSQSSPTSGVCYNATLGAASCEPTTALFLNNGQPLCNGFNPTTNGACFLSYGLPYAPAPTGFEWLALEDGRSGRTNQVTPKFTSFSIEDQYRPTARLHVNAGLRLDKFQFDLPPTAGGPTRAFWFQAWNTAMCVNPGVNGGNPIDETILGLPIGTPCGAIGPGWSQATLTNDSAAGTVTSHSVFQPRVGATFDSSDDDVERLSYGVYAQAPATEAIANDVLQPDLPGSIGPLFYALGYTSPVHDLRPSVSYNADFSWEHRFHRTDAAFKLTPFYRRTRDQIQQFFIDPTFGTVTDINAGRQTSYGVEFQVTRGDFERDGLSSQISYTYTHSRIEYNALPNGSTLLSGVNSSIQQYNSFTSACASATPSTDPNSLCGVFGNANALATFGSGVANPYYNAPARPLLDPFGSYPTFAVVPTGLQLTSASYGVPSYATIVLSERTGKWTIAPLIQLINGSRYGGPQQQIGVDPSSCATLSGGSTAGDPRYPFGASGTGSPYDATTCARTMFIPDQVSGNFDSPGAFREPSQLTANLQVAYRATERTTLRMTATNVYLRCFGGDSEPWNVSDRRFCGYDVLPGHLPPAGNIYNPGDAIQRVVQFPYGIEQQAQPSPPNVYLTVEVKL